MAKGGKNGGGGGGGTIVDLIVTGTNASERLKGGDGNDTILGAGGDDQIDGGAGTDTAVYSGSIFDFTLASGRRGSFNVTDNNNADGDEGVDQLKNIEIIQFEDYTYFLTQENVAIFDYDAVSTYVDTAVTFSVHYADLDDLVTLAGPASNWDTQGRLTLSDYETIRVAQGSAGTYTYTFDPSTADHQHLAAGETDIVSYSFSVSGNYFTVDIEIIGRNEAPTLVAGAAFHTNEDATSASFDLTGLGADIDSDDNGSSLTYRLVSSPADISMALVGSELIVSPNLEHQLLNDGQSHTYVVQIEAIDRHGAVSAVQDVTIVIEGVDDPLPSLLLENGQIDYDALGVSPWSQTSLGVLDGLSGDFDLEELVTFSNADDIKVIRADSMTQFLEEHVVELGMGFITQDGDDTLVVGIESVIADVNFIDIETGNGQDVVSFDIQGQTTGRFDGIQLSTGAHNDRVIINIEAVDFASMWVSDIDLGEGNDFASVRIVKTGAELPALGGLSGFAVSADFNLGAGNNTLLLDLQSTKAPLFGTANIDVSAGNGDDMVAISTGSYLLLGQEAADIGLDGRLNLAGGDNFVFLDLDLNSNAAELRISAYNGFDTVELADGNAADYVITQTYIDSYSVEYGNQTLYLSGIEELILNGTDLLDFV